MIVAHNKKFIALIFGFLIICILFYNNLVINYHSFSGSILIMIVSILILVIGVLYFTGMIGFHRHQKRAKKFLFVSPGLDVPHEPSISQQRNKLSVVIGNSQCRDPYLSSVFEIGFSLSHTKDLSGSIQSNSTGDEVFGNEPGIFELITGNNILQVNRNYGGCSSANGKFNAARFAENAKRLDIKM